MVLPRTLTLNSLGLESTQGKIASGHSIQGEELVSSGRLCPHLQRVADLTWHSELGLPMPESTVFPKKHLV